MEKSIDLLGAIELAMEAERQARMMYSKGVEVTSHPRGKELFRQLADFEQSHYDHLKRLRDSLTGSGRSIDDGGTSTAPSRGEVTGEVEGEPRKQEVLDILNQAIEAEREAQSRYADLARRTPDPAGRAMFRKLSEEEGLHLRILNDEYFHIANQGSWSSKTLWSE